MADFNITFGQNNDRFTFDDLTDYSTIVDEQDSKLVVTYPIITDTATEITQELYNENIAAFGDSFTFVIADIAELGALSDGVYRFKLDIYDSVPVVVDTVTKYFVNHYDIDTCLRRLIDEAIDAQCDDKWDTIGMINALIDSADREAEAGNFSIAQEHIDHATSICSKC